MSSRALAQGSRARADHRRTIARRIKILAREIERDFRGREMVVVSLLNGTVMFLADLVRHLSLPLRLDFMGVSSYGAGTESGDLVFTKELRLDVRGRDVLLVDDILDTGKTMSRVLPKIRVLKPRRIKICVLLDKPSRRVEKVKADYVGFENPGFLCRRLRAGFCGALPQPAVRRRAASAHLQGSPASGSRSLPEMFMELRFISLLGWFTMIAVAWAISYNRKLFPWRTVIWGVGLQFTWPC
jgi:hypoxanthine phosphoribosyltransferase